ncbi:S8 family peptidase [Paenibacillus sp. P96]|uniref:S8 family peptidase n=1 Tax=Paenibacillus zeirhizosphaerae TaxID=2987519 RepID=A0ABT9FWX7_9BACL|nr:S8 family peptidase [Paenibacillus sp. P96]MDP4099227.1 S8 family peptidase [Paenibacillus sp. P96]
MDYPGFLQLLNRAIQEPARSGRAKQIIRFNKASHYRECLSYLQKMKPGLSGLRSVQSSHLIRALIAPMACRERLGKYRNGVVIEEDTRIRVHGGAASLSAEAVSTLPWGVKKIKAHQTWPLSTGSQIRIGVIDTGVDFRHPDLRHCLARGVNLLNRAMLPHDDNGHGTHIAGAIAAASYDRGAVGVAPGAIICPVKAFDHNGSAYVSDIILAIDWCVRNRIDIINMSFGMKTRSKALLDVVNKAHTNGIVIVASSGNDSKRQSIDYPARYPQTISVGATDRFGRIASFSNRGPHVDIYAPGEKILSSWTNNRYHEMSGTSMATSHVSGTIALLLELKPSLSPAEIKALLRRTASPMRRRSGTAPKTSRLGEVDAFRLIREGIKLR